MNNVVVWDRKYNPMRFPSTTIKDEDGNEKVSYTEPIDPKYYRENLDAIILPNRFIKLFGEYLEQGDISIPFILAGRPGHGKTALIEILIRHVGIGYGDFKIIDGSVQRGIDTVREEIIEFASTSKSGSSKKIVFIDEADGFTPQAWNALKRVMKDTNQNCVYCFATNHEDDIPEAVKDSRARVYHLVPRKQEELELYKKCVMNRIFGILKAEGINIIDPVKTITRIVNHFFPDIRQTLIACQEASIMFGQIDDNIFDLGESDINTLVNLIKSYRDKPNDQKILEGLIGEVHKTDATQFYSDIMEHALKIFKPESYLKAISIIGYWKCQYGANPYIKIMCCINEFIDECKFI